MLAKPFIFFLTFLLTIANFVFLLLPMSVVAFPLFFIFHDFFVNAGRDLFLFFIALVSVITLFYMFLDMLFGLTARYLNRKARPFEKMTAVPRHAELMQSFEWLKKKFQMDNAKLFLDPNGDVINAYAIGGANKQSVTLTLGLIFEIHRRYPNEEDYVKAIRGIMGHELSHLANKDFLPGLLAASSEAVNHYVAKFVKFVFLVMVNVLLLVPFLGRYIKFIIYRIYNLMMRFTNLFFRYVFLPLHGFFMRWFGRSIEYRCDRESAYAVGGRAMVLGLDALGKGSYFSIFSTHPRTKSRIKHVEGVIPVSGNITPSFMNTLANAISMLMIVFVMYFATFSTDWNNLSQNYQQEVYYPVSSKYNLVKQKVMNLYYNHIKY